jgi:hypothetical protein
MKKHNYLMSGALALTALFLSLASHEQAQAQCTTNGIPGNIGTAGPDTITCNVPLTNGVRAEGGNDTVTVNGSPDFNVQLNDGDDLLINTGDFIDADIDGQDGNDTIINSGNFISVPFSAVAINGQIGNDSIVNTGDFTEARINGGQGNDTLSNSGAFSNNSRITGGAGDDQIILLPGSAFDGTSWVDGGWMDNDTLILHSPVELSHKFPQCQGQNNIAAMQADGCFLPWEGGVLYFTNFETIQIVLVQVLAQQGIVLSSGPQVICDDGQVKAFKLPNGDVEYYSGFNRLPPNGFMVARVSLLDLANGVRTFPRAGQTPNPLGWTVRLTQTGNSLSGQVFDENGAPVGRACTH